MIEFIDKTIFKELLYFNTYTLLNAIRQDILSQLISLWRIEICTIKSTSHSPGGASNFVFYICVIICHINFIFTIILLGGNSQQSVAVATVTTGQGMPVASHASMPAQPPRSTTMVTTAPVKKPTPPPATTSNPPTPPPSVTPTNTNSIVASPVVPQPPQPPTSVSSFSNANTPVPTDGATLTQQSDLLQPYNSLGMCFIVLYTALYPLNCSDVY